MCYSLFFESFIYKIYYLYSVLVFLFLGGSRGGGKKRESPFFRITKELHCQKREMRKILLTFSLQKKNGNNTFTTGDDSYRKDDDDECGGDLDFPVQTTVKKGSRSDFFFPAYFLRQVDASCENRTCRSRYPLHKTFYLFFQPLWRKKALGKLKCRFSNKVSGFAVQAPRVALEEAGLPTVFEAATNNTRMLVSALFFVSIVSPSQIKLKKYSRIKLALCQICRLR